MIAVLCLKSRHFEHAGKFHQKTLVRRPAGMTASSETLRQELDLLEALPEDGRIIEEAESVCDGGGAIVPWLLPLDNAPLPRRTPARPAAFLQRYSGLRRPPL